MTSLRSIFSLVAMSNISWPALQAGLTTHEMRPATATPEFMWHQAVGCAAVALLMISRMQEPRYPRFHYVSVVCAAICAIYGFASGAWPLGIALGAYTIRLLTQRPRKHIRRVYDYREHPARASYRWVEPSRLERLFGSK